MLTKRIFDLCLAVFALLILSPFLCLLAIVNRFSGPVFYKQKRVGKDGKHFDCYKFRSMVPNAEALKENLAHLNERDGLVFKIADDPRVTRVGKFIRKYGIDELPQLFNIVKGDMSFVGPRPPTPDEVAKYERWQLMRLSTTPGLTCYWQISNRDMSFADWVRLDIYYIETSSFLVDLKLILKTIVYVLSGKHEG